MEIIDFPKFVCYTDFTMKKQSAFLENSQNVYVLYAHRIELETRLLLCNKSVLTKNWFGYNEICTHSTMYYVLEGELLVVIDGEELHAKAGDLLLLPAGIKHDYRLPPPYYAKLYWMDAMISFNGAAISDVFELPYKTNVGYSSKLISIFRSLMRYASSDTPHITSVYQSNLITQLLLFYMEHLPENTAFVYKEPTDPIHETVTYINEHFTEKLTVNELAKMAYLSKNQFTIRFKKITGMPPLQYINHVRLKTAQNLLETTNKSISEIVNELNFYSASQFCKNFKKAFTFSPIEYRKMAKKHIVVKETGNSVLITDADN